jgi:hypothetical protein
MQDFCHFSSISGNKFAVVSILHHGHLYDRYVKHLDQVVNNHKSFADANNFDYFLYNSEINQIEKLHDENFNGPDICLGMSKWFAINHLFENTDYQGVLFVDYDSCFLNFENFKIPEYTCLSPVYGTPYYDAVFLLYYCLAKGVTYTDFVNNTRAHKYNTGFMFVSRNFFNKSDLTDFVDFSKKVYDTVNDKKDTWISQGSFDFSDIMNHTNLTLTPFDEVFLMYNLIKYSHEPIGLFDTEIFNVNNMDIISDKTQHVHFCTNKEQFFEYYEKN